MSTGSARMAVRLIGSACAAALLVSACASTGDREQQSRPMTSPAPAATPDGSPRPAQAARADTVSTTLLPGRTPPPGTGAAGAQTPRPGDVTLNFPNAAVPDVARAVLGDLLQLRFSVDPAVQGTVSVVTPYPIARAEVLPFLEQALRTSGLALVSSDGQLTIAPLAQARTAAPALAAGEAGFGSETVNLQFITAGALRRLIEPVLPGVVQPGSETDMTLVMTGTTGQRASIRDLVRQFDVNWLRNMSFALFVPRRTDSRLIVPELDELLNGEDAPTRGLVRLIAMEQLNGILAVSRQEQYLGDVQRWIEVLDREGESSQKRLFVYRVQNGRSQDLARVLSRAFGRSGGEAAGEGVALDDLHQVMTGPSTRTSGSAADAGGDDSRSGGSARDGAGNGNDRGALRMDQIDASITSDDTNNALLVYATPRTYAVVEDALRKLDVLPFQVMIEAAIAEVSLNNGLRYGVQWLFSSGNTQTGFGQGNTPTPTRILPGYTFLYSNNTSITATLNALEGLTKVNVLSAPKLLVLNNQSASLQIGDQVPVASGSAVSVENPGAPIVNSIEYKDTGVILKVTPRVNNGGLVLLDIAQEVSDVAQTSTSSLNSPTIQTRKIASSIAVQDGQTVALGGLIRQKLTRGRSGIPLISRIPIIGGLAFGATDNRDDRVELLVLLRPTVLRTIDDGRAVTEELKRKIQSLRLFSPDGSIP